LLVALISPLDVLSDALFAAHMTQHELLMLVAAPLMVIGRPWIAFLWSLPAPLRNRMLAAVRRPPALRVWRALTHPLWVAGLLAATLWAWHVPWLFEAALRNQAVHALQHAMFFATSALFFFALVNGRYGRVGYGASACFVFATAGHSGLLGALLTLGNRIWYPLQSVGGLTYGVCPLEDQQLAGLIMWVPAGVILALVALALCAAWIGESERRVRAHEQRSSAI
jgi:putative membrane protein